MKKRIFSILLSIGLTLTLLPGTVLATGPDAGPAEEVIAASQTPVLIETAEEPLQTPDEAEEAELLQVPEEIPGEVTPEKETPGEEIMALQAAAQGETVSQAIQTDALGADAPTAITSVDITVNVPAAGTTVGNAKNAVSVPSGANYIAACAGYYEYDPLPPGEAVDIGQSDYLIGYYGDIKFEDGIGSALPDEATFAAGQTYYMDIRLAANDGYMFRQAVPGTAITVSGAKLIGENTLSITNTASEDSMRSYGSFRVSFTVPEADTPTKDMHVATYGHGKVLINGNDYGTEFQGTWPEGTEVQVEAVPDEGYRLDRWWIKRENPVDNIFSENTKITLVAGTDLEAYASFGLKTAYVTITPPAAGTTAGTTTPQITLPAGAGYTLDPNTEAWRESNVMWVKAGSSYSSHETLEPDTIFEAGQTYYAYVRLAEGEDSFAEKAGGSTFDTNLEVSGGTKMNQGNFAATTDSRFGYMGIMAIIAVTVPEANTHTVTFDTGGHFAAPESQNVEDGGYATEPTTPSWRQYTPATDGSGLYFHAWYIAPPDDTFTYTDLNYSRANGGKIFDFNAEAITADTTVYAGWDTVLETRSYDVTNSALSQGGQTRVGSVYYDGSSYTPFVGNTTAIAGTEATVYAKPDDGYTFVGWSTTTSKDDIVDTATEYTFTVTSKASYYALFEKEAPSYDLRFAFKDYLRRPVPPTGLVTSVTINGEDWPLPATGTDITKPVPAKSRVTAVLKAADGAAFFDVYDQYNPDLESQFSEDRSTCTLTFTMSDWGALGVTEEIQIIVDKAVDIRYDANGGTKGPAWYGGQGDVEILPAFAVDGWTEWKVDDLLVDPSSHKIVVYPPEGATSAGVEITDKKGVHTGAPGTTITGLDLTEGATIKYLWTKDIDKVEVSLNAPVCGTETATPDKDHSWGSQTNPPSVSVPDGAGYKPLIMYEGASPAIWVDPDQEYNPFEGKIDGGKSYTAQIMLVPDSGAVFSEDVEIVVNGGTLVDKDLNGSVLAVFASVTAVHDPADPVEENRVEPTCVTAGSYEEVVYCAGCSTELSRETKEIPATGHTPGSPVKENEVAPTCTEAGSYDEVVYCTVCSEEISREKKELPAPGHVWNEGDVTTEPGCTTPGVKTFTCTVCGETKTEEIQPLGHAWGEWTQTTEPTCTDPGEETRTCTRCGEAETREVAALGHDWGEWIVDKEATEEEDGRRHRECSRCDAVEVEKIPMIVASYGVAEGDGATWYTGSNDSLTFTFKRSVNDEKTFDLFQRIEIDGKEVAPANYEAKAGSVIITLKPEYIKTLAVGKHKLTAFFEDGKSADATFTIAEKKADVVPGGDTAKKGTGVKTGDNANTVLYMGLGIAALLIIAVTLILLKRRSRNEQ